MKLWKVALVLLAAAAVLGGCPGTRHTVKLGYMYEPEDTDVTTVVHYGASVGVSVGMPEISVEGCGLFNYVHRENANEHNFPGSYCLEVDLAELQAP